MFRDFKALARSRRIVVSLLAIPVGVLGGIGAIIFKVMIDLNNYAFFGLLLPIISVNNQYYNYSVLLLPALGALIVGIVVGKYALEAKGHGIPQVIECMTFKCGRIRSRVAAAKIITSSITLGSGGSAGKEGPIAQIGATLGSMTGQALRLSDRDVELLVVCGLASGIAATFNAPLGGAIFGLEILFRRFDVIEAVPVLLASVFGTIVARIFFGNFISLPLPVYAIPQLDELLLYALIGIGFGIVSALWVRLFYLVEGGFNRMNRIPFALRVTMGGLITGLIGLPFYALSLAQFGDNSGFGVYGVGYAGINFLLAGAIPISLMLLLGLAKMAGTSFTLGAGGSGGLLVPTLYIGSMLGGAMGLTLYSLTPGLISQPYAYALVGAGALFAGAYGTPIAPMIFIPEMASNFTLLLPLMLSCSLSHLVARQLLKGSTINTVPLERKGILLSELTNQMSTDILQRIKVKEVMMKKFVKVDPETPVKDVSHLIGSKGLEAYPVMKEGRLVGIVDYRSVIDLSAEDMKSRFVRDIMKHADTIGPEEALSEAVATMYDLNAPRLVVLDPRGEGVIGFLTHEDIVKGYEEVRHGHRIQESDPLKRAKAREVMIRNPAKLSPDQPVEDLIKESKDRLNLGYPVMSRGKYLGMLISKELIHLRRSLRGELKVRDVMRRDVPIASPEETLDKVLEKMHKSRVTVIPVFEEGKRGKLLGIITEMEVIKGYQEQK